MTLADAAKAATKPRGTPCTVGALIDAGRNAPAGDPLIELVDELASALADPEVTPAGLARALAARGRPIGQHTIGRHMRKDCRCAK